MRDETKTITVTATLAYTVIGLYTDNYQRFAECVRAASPEDAERRILEKYDHPDLCIAGVIRGDHTPVY